eukprot:31405-Pelagococcus_subviridis.AAC.18
MALASPRAPRTRGCAGTSSRRAVAARCSVAAETSADGDDPSASAGSVASGSPSSDSSDFLSTIFLALDCIAITFSRSSALRFASGSKSSSSGSLGAGARGGVAGSAAGSLFAGGGGGIGGVDGSFRSFDRSFGLDGVPYSRMFLLDDRPRKLD